MLLKHSLEIFVLDMQVFMQGLFIFGWASATTHDIYLYLTIAVHGDDVAVAHLDG